MPFKSQAQRAKFHALVAQGKMKQSTLDEWEASTPKDKKLPERVTDKKPVIRSLSELRELAKKKLGR